VQSKAIDRPLPPPVKDGKRIFVPVQRQSQELFVCLFSQQRHLGHTSAAVVISISPQRVRKFRPLQLLWKFLQRNVIFGVIAITTFEPLTAVQDEDVSSGKLLLQQTFNLSPLVSLMLPVCSPHQ
jgi:hypothetical protein